MQTKSGRWFVVAAYFLVAWLIGAASAAQPGDGVAGLFGEVIDVRVVNLEVVVTTPEGERVHGLEAEDFILRVDRRPIPIEYFTEVRDGTAVAAESESDLSAVPSLTPASEVSTNYLVFIDEYFAIDRDRDRAVDGLIAQLPLLGGADRMAVLAWNGGKLEMLSNWSRSANDLRRTLELAKDRSTSGLQRELELRRPFGARRLRGEAEHTARRLGERVERVMQAATTALRSFARPAGRRAMLLLAGGWPLNPWDAVVPDPFGPALFSPNLDYGPCLYRQLHDTANRLGYTLYPVDVRGFGPSAPMGAMHRTPDAARYDWQLSSGREWSEHSALNLLAHQTGGQAFINSSSSKALERVVTDTRSYYWLGFTPAWQGTDRRHRLEIRTRDARLEVRSRRSFSDLSRRTEVDMMVESALLFGDPPGPLTLAVELGDVEGAGFRKVMVPLAVTVPLDALTFLPSREGWAAEIELRIAVEDKHGDRNEIALLQLRFPTVSAPRPGAVGLYRTPVKMRRLRHDMVVSVHDPPSGRMLWTRLEFDPAG